MRLRTAGSLVLISLAASVALADEPVLTQSAPPVPAERPAQQHVNFRTSPIGLLFAVATANLDVRVAAPVTVGLSFAYFRGSTNLTVSDYYEYGMSMV
jgi:hypothetical protein